MDKTEWKLMQIKSEDQVSRGQTDDSLVSPQASREAVHSGKSILPIICQTSVRRKFGRYKLIVTSIILSIFGLLQILFPPYDLLLNLRLRMTPGLPAFDWWVVPPDEAIVNVYIFNVTNAETFLNETDLKIKVEEVGPIIFRENLIHKNIIFNRNGTLTYTSNRSLIYLPERNPVYMMNKTIVVPNLAVWFVPSYLYNAPFFVRFGVNMLMRHLKSELFKTVTIQEFLWNMTDPLLETSQKIAPSIVTTNNVGILHTIYKNYEDTATVYVGPKYGDRKFFRIDKYDGSEYMPYLKKCNDKVQGSTDDLMYHQAITKNDTLRFFRKTLCRVVNLLYTRDFNRYGMNGYRFEMDPHFYDRSYPATTDCYRGEPILPDGLIDVSSCTYESTIAASFPHFLYGDPALKKSIDGLKPDKEKHMPFVEVEPNTGIPFLGAAKSQINLVIKDMTGFNARLHKFSNLNIPIVWIEVVQETLPLKIQWMVYIQVIVLPVFEKVLVVFTFVVAFALLMLFMKRKRRRLAERHLAMNKALAFESQKFIKS